MLQVMTSVEQRTSSVALPPKKRFLFEQSQVMTAQRGISFCDSQHIKEEETEKQTLLKRGAKRVKRDWSQLVTNVKKETSLSDFKRESVRLASFASWPSFSKVLPVDLARAGFYYKKKKGSLDEDTGHWTLDTVICPFCKKWVEGWADDDVPAKEHAKESPACPFVTGRNLGIKDVGIRAWRRKSRSRSKPVEGRRRSI